MTPLGPVGDIYIVSCAIGMIYLLAGAFLGHFTGGDGHGLHTDFGHGHGVGDAGHGAGHSDVSHGSHGHGDADTTQSKLGVLPANIRGRVNPLRFILSLLSPLTIAVFLTFFGATGFFVLRVAPWLAMWSTVPAAIVALLITGQAMSALGWMIGNMHVTSQPNTNDLIGQRADVVVPIDPGATGEVVYVIGHSRYNKPARSLNPNDRFPQGSKVIISDVQGYFVLVESWKDLLLDDNFPDKSNNAESPKLLNDSTKEITGG